MSEQVAEILAIAELFLRGTERAIGPRVWWQYWCIQCIIKPAVHRGDGHLGGNYRSQMTDEMPQDKSYGRRWLVETFMSGLKRKTGADLTARNEQALFIEASRRVPAYALWR